jgi:hypothetical protein
VAGFGTIARDRAWMACGRFFDEQITPPFSVFKENAQYYQLVRSKFGYLLAGCPNSNFLSF